MRTTLGSWAVHEGEGHVGLALGPHLPEPQAQRRTGSPHTFSWLPYSLESLLVGLSPLPGLSSWEAEPSHFGEVEGVGRGGRKVAATRAWESVGEAATWPRWVGVFSGRWGSKCGRCPPEVAVMRSRRKLAPQRGWEPRRVWGRSTAQESVR